VTTQAGAAPESERVRLFGLEGELLASSPRGDGRHCVLRIEHDGRPLVVKLYGRKRDAFKDKLRDLGHRWIVGKTGMEPATRMRTERETIELWHRHGFAVPKIVDVELPAETPPLRLVYEFVQGKIALGWFASGQIELAEKIRRLEGLARGWSRRHDLAIELSEPRLVQAHATLDHVILVPGNPGDGSSMDFQDLFVTFDFEVAWARSSVLPRLVSLELAQHLDSLVRRAPRWHVEALFDAFARAYPDRERLERLPDDVRRGRLPFVTLLTRAGLALREGGPGRKLEALALLERALAARS